MSDEHKLPPLEDDTNQETVPNQARREQPRPASTEDTDRLPRTRSMRPAQPPPSGSHVQPIPGQARRATPPHYPARPPRRSAQHSGLYLPWWSLVIMLIVVLVVSFGLVGLVYLLGNPGGIVDDATPIIRIITAQPSAAVPTVPPTAEAPATQIIAGSSPPGELALQGPTLEAVQFTPTPIPITVGSQVAVEGVDEQMLNVRDSAGVTGTTVLFRAEEETVFTVVDGPVQADGFTWWRIQDPQNPSRAGWAVANFLRVIPGA